MFKDVTPTEWVIAGVAIGILVIGLFVLYLISTELVRRY